VYDELKGRSFYCFAKNVSVFLNSYSAPPWLSVFVPKKRETETEVAESEQRLYFLFVYLLLIVWFRC
jgi:hypothetical protein